MKAFEYFLVKLDDWPLSAAWRIGLGLVIPPVFQIIGGNRDGVWTYFGLFIVLLMALRVGPALLRFTLPFPAEIKAVWRNRRFLSKEHDSFQWQKLFWIGLGMVPHAVLGSGLGAGGLALAMFSLIGGGTGLVFWMAAQRAAHDQQVSDGKPQQFTAQATARPPVGATAFVVSTPGMSDRDKG